MKYIIIFIIILLGVCLCAVTHNNIKLREDVREYKKVAIECNNAILKHQGCIDELGL